MGFHVADQAAEHLHAAGPAYKLRMQHKIDHAALYSQGIKFLLPDLKHLIRGFESVALRGSIGIKVVGGIIENGILRKLHQRNGLTVNLMKKRAVTVAPVAAVNIAVLQKQAQAVVMDNAARCPVSGNLLPGQIIDDLLTAVHGGIFLLIGSFCGFLMQIAMKADVVSSACNLLHDLRVMLSDYAGNEKGCLYLVAVQHVKDARYTLFGAVGAAGKVCHMGSTAVSVSGPHRFCVQVKCHHHGNAFVVRPVHHALFPPFCFCT